MLPYQFEINLGHILDQHGFKTDNKYVKSMFCTDLSEHLAFWHLITFAFVAVFDNPKSNGPDVIHSGAEDPEYLVTKYQYSFRLGWSI